MLKIQHLGLVIRILEVWIQIPILESVFRGEEVKFGLAIRIPKVVIRIRFQKVMKIEKRKNDSNLFVKDSNLQGKISNRSCK